VNSKKDTAKWCEFHNNPWENTDECLLIQSLVAKIKEKETNPELEPFSKNNKRRHSIYAEPTSIVAIATIQP
jgi:hypothetical protein